MQLAVSKPAQIHLLLNCLYPSALFSSLPGRRQSRNHRQTGSRDVQSDHHHSALINISADNCYRYHGVLMWKKGLWTLNVLLPQSPSVCVSAAPLTFSSAPFCLLLRLTGQCQQDIGKAMCWGQPHVKGHQQLSWIRDIKFQSPKIRTLDPNNKGLKWYSKYLKDVL